MTLELRGTLSSTFHNKNCLVWLKLFYLSKKVPNAIALEILKAEQQDGTPVFLVISAYQAIIYMASRERNWEKEIGKHGKCDGSLVETEESFTQKNSEKGGEDKR